jgi:hypothetical protein
MRKAILSAAMLAVLAVPSVASASVAVDSGGYGFVGKGDVQVAFGWNNAALQKNASGVSFTSKQDATQALSQSATQVATMAVTQSVSRDVSCVTDTGRKTFHRDGSRSGTRSGSRTGSRDGSRSGTLAGTIKSAIAYDARVKNQITGFTLKGSGTPVFTASGSNEFGAWTFGAYSFGNASLGDIEWGGWQSESGENPASCLESGNNELVTELSDVTTEGAVVDDAVTDGAITEGAIAYGAVTGTGAAQVYVNYGSLSVALPNTPVAAI